MVICCICKLPVFRCSYSQGILAGTWSYIKALNSNYIRVHQLPAAAFIQPITGMNGTAAAAESFMLLQQEKQQCECLGWEAHFLSPLSVLKPHFLSPLSKPAVKPLWSLLQARLGRHCVMAERHGC